MDAHVNRDESEVFARIAADMQVDPAVTEGRMFGSAGLKVGGKVFAMLVRGRLVLKLPKGRVNALIESGEGEPFDPGHGRAMREWVSLRCETGAWADLVSEARTFVESGA